MRRILFSCLAVVVAGCGQDVTRTETAVKVVTVEPPPKPALPNECKPQSQRRPPTIKKVTGDKTELSALAHAAATATKRMRDNYATVKSCYCWAANNVASDADLQEAKPMCASTKELEHGRDASYSLPPAKPQ